MPEKLTDDFEYSLASQLGVQATRLEGRAFRDFFGRWQESFFANVKRTTGKWVYRGIHWHAYSYAIEQAVCGSQAFELLQAAPIEPFYLFHEIRDQLFQCSAKCWPDLRVVEDDLYLVPNSLRWMFVITHELRLGLGPYFTYANQPTESVGDIGG